MAKKETYEQRQSRKELKAPTWVRECVEYWECKVYEGDLGTDFSEATTNCWRCGHLRKLQKCHIIPKSLGGEDKPENIIPLCYQCHDEMPDVNDKDEVFKWIKSSHGTCYETFWGDYALKQSEIKLDDAINNSKDPEAKIALFIERYAFYYAQTSVHFGQFAGGCKHKPRSKVWILKKAYANTFEATPVESVQPS